jgi:hypothetical protein
LEGVVIFTLQPLYPHENVPNALLLAVEVSFRASVGVSE